MTKDYLLSRGVSDSITQPRQHQSLICNISPAGNICYQGWKPGEIVEVNNYYPFGLMHNYTATTQNAYQYKYNGKELQESGMYDYGARFYMPDIGRWGVVDPLAESSRRFTPYHYGNNNPIRFIDPDGRLTMDNLSTYSHGSAVADFINRNGFGDDYLPMFYRDEGGMMIVNQALGDNGQGGGSSGYTFTGNAAGSMYNYFLNGGSVSGLSFKNGYAKWWEGDASETGYRIGDEMYGKGNVGIMRSLKFNSDTSWDAYKDWTDYSSQAIGGMYEFAAGHRTILYNRGYWIDNLGNQRSIRYNGRAVDSQIGLRSNYVRTTAKFGQYAKRAGWIGNAIGVIEVGNGVVTDINDFNTNGITYGKNTAMATGSVIGGIGGTWAGIKAGAAIGGIIGTAFPVVGNAAGALVGGIVGGIVVGIIGSNIGESVVEKAYE